MVFSVAARCAAARIHTTVVAAQRQTLRILSRLSRLPALPAQALLLGGAVLAVGALSSWQLQRHLSAQLMQQALSAEKLQVQADVAQFNEALSEAERSVVRLSALMSAINTTGPQARQAAARFDQLVAVMPMGPGAVVLSSSSQASRPDSGFPHRQRALNPHALSSPRLKPPSACSGWGCRAASWRTRWFCRSAAANWSSGPPSRRSSAMRRPISTIAPPLGSS